MQEMKKSGGRMWGNLLEWEPASKAALLFGVIRYPQSVHSLGVLSAGFCGRSAPEVRES